MPYRSDIESLKVRRQDLADELDLLRRAQRPLRVVESELREVDGALSARHGIRIPLLRAPRIPVPCNVPWETMVGDQQKRRCGECKKDVYDLSAMTVVEAALLLRKSTDRCVRYYERPDGTVLTARCDTTARVALKITGGALLATALAAATVSALSPKAPTPNEQVDQFALNPARIGHHARVTGTLVPGSMEDVRTGWKGFRLSSPSGAVLRVRMEGIFPDALRDSPGVSLAVVAEGVLQPDGTFEADLVIPLVRNQGYVMRER